MLLDDKFRKACRQYLTSARPIQSVEHLKGREKALRRLVEAIDGPGRHAFIYGDRGVGKTSLAHTGAFQAQSSKASPILVACDNQSTFSSICVAIVKRLLDIKPLETKGYKISGGVEAYGANLNLGLERPASKPEIDISDVNDAVFWFRKAVDRVGFEPIVIIDEFDLFPIPVEHDNFSALIKQLSDQCVPIKLIFCGIAESLDQLFRAHESTHRYFHAERLERLSLGNCMEICDDASNGLKIDVPTHIRYRIAQISDGFPYYVHLVCEKMFLNAHSDKKRIVDQQCFDFAINQAIDSIEPRLKRPYENSVHKNTKNSEPILWALANDKLLDVQSSSIWRHYDEICSALKIDKIKKANFATKLNNLSKPQYGEILVKPRRSYYTFNEKMLRGYARLRCARAGYNPGPENPGA